MSSRFSFLLNYTNLKKKGGGGRNVVYLKYILIFEKDRQRDRSARHDFAHYDVCKHTKIATFHICVNIDILTFFPPKEKNIYPCLISKVLVIVPMIAREFLMNKKRNIRLFNVVWYTVIPLPLLFYSDMQTTELKPGHFLVTRDRARNLTRLARSENYNKLGIFDIDP